MSRIQINHRILTCESQVTAALDFSADPGINLSDDTVFEFLNEEYVRKSANSSFDDHEDDDENEISSRENAKDDNFWEAQFHLLKETIRRTNSVESKIRSAVKEALKEAQVAGKSCSCRNNIPFHTSCRKCLMQEVVLQLQTYGFNASICKSKWRNSPNIPSGEHTFMEVTQTSNPNNKEVRVIIELNFRAEFEMARANPQYDSLIKALPEIFVGKIERLTAVLKILCAAAKKCMKEKKQHMGPWRKHRYMQAKWLTTPDRHVAVAQPSSGECSGRLARPRMSLLTRDLAGNFDIVCRTAAVEAA